MNALGVEKVYIVTDNGSLPEEWHAMRARRQLNAISASAIKWTFVKIFRDTASCLTHLEKSGVVSIVTSPHTKGRTNGVRSEGDFTRHRKLAVWFGNEGSGMSSLALERSESRVNTPMCGIVESLNLGTSSGIVLYEVTKHRRAFQATRQARIAAKRRSRGAA